jgi:hypothetical protein
VGIAKIQSQSVKAPMRRGGGSGGRPREHARTRVEGVFWVHWLRTMFEFRTECTALRSQSAQPLRPFIRITNKTLRHQGTARCGL